MFCKPITNKLVRNDAYEKKLRLFIKTSNISLFIDAVKEYYDNKCECVGFCFSYNIGVYSDSRIYDTKEVVYFSFKALFSDHLKRIDLLFDENYLVSAIEKHEWENGAQQFIELPEMYNVELKYSRYVLAG